MAVTSTVNATPAGYAQARPRTGREDADERRAALVQIAKPAVAFAAARDRDRDRAADERRGREQKQGYRAHGQPNKLAAAADGPAQSEPTIASERPRLEATPGKAWSTQNRP